MMALLPRAAPGSHGSAMLPSIADAAPAVFGVLLVFGGFLGDLVLAAGIPAATPSALPPSLDAAKSNRTAESSRYTYDTLQRRSQHVDQTRHPPAQITGAAISQRSIDESFMAESGVAPAGPGRALLFGDLGVAPGSRAAVATARSGPDTALALGTRVRPIATRKAAPTTAVSEGEARKKKDKKDDDDYDDDYDDDDKSSKQGGGPAKTFKIKKHKLKKWLLPLLVGYKLKFMTLVPLLFATLALLVASAGFAGFFFAMFTAALTLPKSGGHH